MAKNTAQLNPMASGNALAGTGALFHIVCSLLFGFSRPAYMMMMSGWSDNVNVGYLPGTTLMGGGTISSFLTMIVVGWIAGYVYASFYNWFLTR